MRAALLVVTALALSPLGVRADAGHFSLEQILSAPFPTDLVAEPDGARFAWVSNERGRRGVWLATPQAGGTYATRLLIRYADDDGLDVADLAFVSHRDALLFVRGGDFEFNDKPAPNPAQLPMGVEQTVYWLDLKTGPKGRAPRPLGPGHAPVVSPSGDRVLFLHKGEIWSASVASPPVGPPPGGGNASPLFKVRGDLDQPRFSPDGSMLAFVANRGDHSFVGIYSFADRTLRWVEPSLGLDLEPRWSPDGKRLAYLHLPSTHDEVGIGPHRAGDPWRIRVAEVVPGAAPIGAIDIYRAPPGAGSVFHGLASEAQLLWTSDGRVVFPAETDGWLHLYGVPAGGGPAGRGPAQLLTPGDFEIEYATASRDGAVLVYAGNAGDIDRRHLWRLDLHSGEVTALTSGDGIETLPVFAGDASAVGFLRSDARRPMRPAVLAGSTPAAGAAAGLELTGDPLPGDFPTTLVTPQSVVLPARAGLAAHAQIFLPPSGSARQRHPALVFMHGGPIRQMLAGWHYMDYYSNAYGMNQYLASRGYVVLALNYRAGIGYGLDYREAEHYGATGASEYNDVLAAADYLRARPDVDPARIGLWGGSYGGYLTAMGLARNSDLFAAGVDLHGVHDWVRWSLAGRDGRDYYPLDVPPDAVATAIGASPISSVATWRSPVLFIHGDDDHNVDFAETVRLAEALRAQGVEYSELVFPDEIHGFLRHQSWLRAYHATADFLDRHLGDAAAAR
jgi:dipeptidyl aminopeptidase/acylaminoacyl peptidase